MKLVKTKMPARANEDYLNLVRQFPLRKIRSATEHESAIAMIKNLSSKGDDRLTDGEVYLGALARFVGDWERQELLADLKGATPREGLTHLMDSRGMTSADLGDLLASRPAASMILKGRRELSKVQIRVIAAHFCVSPAVFI